MLEEEAKQSVHRGGRWLTGCQWSGPLRLEHFAELTPPPTCSGRVGPTLACGGRELAPPHVWAAWKSWLQRLGHWRAAGPDPHLLCGGMSTGEMCVSPQCPPPMPATCPCHALPLDSCSTWESIPHTLLGQPSRAGPGGMGTDELAG